MNSDPVYSGESDPDTVYPEDFDPDPFYPGGSGLSWRVLEIRIRVRFILEISNRIRFILKISIRIWFILVADPDSASPEESEPDPVNLRPDLQPLNMVR